METATAVKERGIIFSGPMVRAILGGRKSQTRRVVKPQPVTVQGELTTGGVWLVDGKWHIACPYQSGMRLWVREAWSPDHAAFYPHFPVVYRADGYPSDADLRFCAEDFEGFRWRSPLHMPRRLSRLNLEVTGVRVEKLGDISDADCIAEGIEPAGVTSDTGEPCWRLYDGGVMRTALPRESYRSLWDSLHGAGGFDQGPWVWCVSFKRLEAPDA